MTDDINKPSHYTGHGVEHVDALEAASVNWPWSIAPHLTHSFGYLFRCGAKDDPLKDLKKMRWWIDRAIKKLEGKSK